MKLTVYQLDPQRLGNALLWRDEGEKPITNAQAYNEVFRGEGNWNSIQEAVAQLEIQGHPLLRGRAIQPSDVFVTEQGAYFRGWEGLVEVSFDTGQTQKPEETYRVVYVEPGKPAYEAELGSDIKWLQKAVGGGLIECVYAHNDQTLIVGNDEAKLIGMEGNRWVGRGILMAGPFFVIGQKADDFRSLTEAEVNRYVQLYAEPQQIPQQEVRMISVIHSSRFNEVKEMKFSAKIDRFVKDSPIKAIASVTLDGMFVVKNLRIVDGAKGCFVAMPQEAYTDKQGNTKFRDVFFPMNKNARAALESAVLSAYDVEMYQNPPDWATDEGEILPMSM